MEYVYWVIENKLAGRPGSVRRPWNPATLYAGGIRVVVSLAAEEPVDGLSRYGLEHYQAQFPPIYLFSVGIRKAFIHEALPVWAFIHEKLHAGLPTLVHCHAGQDRTGLILAGYLVIYLGITPQAAVARVRAKNPLALSAPGFEKAVSLLQPGQLPDPRTLL